jgi:hypothetical protein
MLQQGKKMKHINESRVDAQSFVENPRQIYDRLVQTTVSEALIADAIELYADKEIPNEGDRDEFVEKYGDPAYEPIVKKAVLDVVVCVVAAHTVELDDTFRSIMNMLDIEETEDVIRRMKLFMLQKMVEDATGDMDDANAEQTFKRRMDLVVSMIG